MVKWQLKTSLLVEQLNATHDRIAQSLGPNLSPFARWTTAFWSHNLPLDNTMGMVSSAATVQMMQKCLVARQEGGGLHQILTLRRLQTVGTLVYHNVWKLLVELLPKRESPKSTSLWIFAQEVAIAS